MQPIPIPAKTTYLTNVVVFADAKGAGKDTTKL